MSAAQHPKTEDTRNTSIKPREGISLTRTHWRTAVRRAKKSCHAEQRDYRIDAWRRAIVSRLKNLNNRNPNERGTVTVDHIEDLLEASGYRCRWTGIELSPFKDEPNALALDHIHPISRGGKHCLENVQVVSAVFNRMKHTLTMEELVWLCRRIVKEADNVGLAGEVAGFSDERGSTGCEGT
jgi:5-methylcytosine-specific restriction endonuclease McrA